MKNNLINAALLLVLTTALMRIFFSSSQLNVSFSQNNYYKRNYLFGDSTNSSSVSSSACILPKLDPWDKTIQKFIDISFRHFKHCVSKKWPVETKLSESELSILRQNINLTFICEYRCLKYKHEFKFSTTDWITFEKPTKPNCEIVETRCQNGDVTVHENLHTQVLKVQDMKNDSRGTLRPSVLLFIFDSVSNSNGLRSLNTTMNILQSKYNAVNFRGLNKVGISSRPNAWALLTGIRIQGLPSGTVYKQELKSELPNSCKEHVDDFPYVGRNFSAAGYVSALIEDWATGMFNWQYCSGFRKNPVTHNMKPFWQKLNNFDGGTPQLLRKKCKSTYDVSMEYLKQFLNAYDANDPKFTIVWLVEPSHNTVNGLYQHDQSLAKFFSEYEQKLQSSFVFLMADHGLRFSKFRQTKVGEIEDNNPLLFVAAPKFLRSNAQLMESLKLNSQKLVTHYDLYLTLMDIATIAPLKNFTDFSYFDWTGFMSTNRGSSLLRPIDSSNRNCETLEIPESYCLCHRNTTIVTIKNGGKDNTLLTEGAKCLVADLNSILRKYNVTKQCAKLDLEAVQSAEMFIENGIIFYSITYRVSPSNGVFQGSVQLLNDNKTFSLVSKIQNRINRYGESSRCVKGEERLKPICFCL